VNRYLRWYSIVIWLGILVNAIFWVPALFAPPILINALGIEGGFWTMWLRNTGMLLILVALFNAAAALAPARYPLLSWLVVVARLIAASFFLQVWLFNPLHSSDRPEVFMWFFIVDASLGIIKGILLYLGLKNLGATQATTHRRF
jgi:hypothetical protein